MSILLAMQLCSRVFMSLLAAILLCSRVFMCNRCSPQRCRGLNVAARGQYEATLHLHAHFFLLWCSASVHAWSSSGPTSKSPCHFWDVDVERQRIVGGPGTASTSTRRATVQANRVGDTRYWCLSYFLLTQNIYILSPDIPNIRYKL